MTFEEAMRYYESLRRGGIRPGLDRMRRAMELARDPHRHLRVVHIAGTNGKGSTARMIQSILTAAGWQVGLYSSPSVTGVCDTITVDGTPISPETFATLTDTWRQRQPLMGEVGELSEFEMVTALALDWFRQERVDICVLECGMGGGQDATNICPPPLAAVLTPIALDHTAFLGDTIEEITTEKCGIIKSPCAVVTSPAQSPEALAVIYEQAAEKGLTVRQPGRGAATLLARRAGEVTFSFGDTTYTVPLGGDFQVDNALTALETVEALSASGFPVGTAAKQQGLAAATLPCRQEVICRTPLRLIDGAHNPHGIAALAEALKQNIAGQPLTLLFGMLRDKDTAACAALLAPLATRVVCCTPPSERALPAADLAAGFRAAGVAEVQVMENPAEALRLAERLAGENPWVVGGSFYTAAAVRPYMT